MTKKKIEKPEPDSGRATKEIVTDCPKCGSQYKERMGGLECRHCGLVETYRGVVLRLTTKKQ